MILTAQEQARFWAKVATASPQECWNWTASLRGWDGQAKYGQFARSAKSCRADGGPRIMYAHRIAWCAARGFPLDYLTDSLSVMHTCDNPLCCNPLHLELGTQLSNIQDMVRKGRNRNSRRKKNSPEQEIPV